MKVVVAGGDGYIGSRVYRRLSLMPGMQAYRLSRRSVEPGSAAPIDLVRAPDTVVSMLNTFKPDVVVNCAGTTSADLRTCVESHILATANLLTAMSQVVPGARLVQLGSAAEYGQAVPEPLLINEETPPRPQGAYGVSKLASTMLAVTHGPVLGLECIALRIFNLLGPAMPQGTIVPKVLGFLSHSDRKPHDPLEIGRLDVYRDFVHVEDVVSAVVAAMTAPLPESGTIINIASSEPVMVRVLVQRLLVAAGHKGEISEITSGSNRSAGVSWQHADISRAREVLAWAPEKNLSDSVLELVRGNGERAS